MDELFLPDFFRRYQAAVAGSGPMLPTLPEPEDPESDEEPSVFLEEELPFDQWKPIIVLEVPTKPGESPLRFIDGSQRHLTVMWLRSPLGAPIPLLVAEVGAVAMRLDGRQFLREDVKIERVLSSARTLLAISALMRFPRLISQGRIEAYH